MNALPQSIETALEEAGFVGSEILILKRLLEEDALTVREIASRTGKSTGILDQSMKKLVQKGIVEKQWINETTRYSISSLDSVARWMADDMRKKHELMLRRHQNFEAFLSTLKIDKNRPEVRYYDGIAGLATAYRELLKPGQELISFTPVYCAIEDDPLRDFHVEFFRDRRRRGIFQRVITHNTALGRRYQTRDPFEYRQSVLISETQFPFSFEKIVAGDYVACFNHSEKRACVMRYPELASMERGMFEGMWQNATKQEPPAEIVETATPAPPIPAQQAVPVDIPLSTKTLSGLREFFLTKRSIGILLTLAAIAGATTYGLYAYSKNINTKRIQERVLAIVSTAANEIDPALMQSIREPDDVNTAQYKQLHQELRTIMQTNPGIAQTYLLRPLSKPEEWQLIVDADYKEPAMPGEIFDDTGSEPASILALKRPLAFEEFTDRWGTWISAYAPIFDETGKPVAVLGADIDASEPHKLTTSAFSFSLCFFALFLIFVIIRMAAFNKSLMQEISEALNFKKILKTLPISIGLAILCTAAVYLFTSHLQVQRMRDKLESIAITGALQLRAEDLNALQKEEDWKKPEWDKVVTQLEDIREGNDGILFVYLYRRTGPSSVVFITDSHSRNPYANVDDDPTNDVDTNDDGKIEIEGPDKLQWPGQYFGEPTETVFKGFEKPISTKSATEDSFGKVFSGFAPVRDLSGQAVALLGVDMKAEKLQELVQEAVNPFVYFIVFLLILCVIQLFIFNQKLMMHGIKVFKLRQLLIGLTLCAEIAFFVSLGLREYFIRNAIDIAGTSAMTTAAAAAALINPKDLDVLRFPRDMRTPEYQRVYTILRAARSTNPDIVWIYIHRKLPGDENAFEFAADADSNYNAPLFVDYDEDGIIDASDENVAPGLGAYSYKPKTENEGLMRPTYDTSPYTDKWGTWITGYAPVSENYVVGADINMQEILQKVKGQFSVPVGFFSALSCLLIISILIRKIK